MSEDTYFEDSTNFGHLLIALVVLISMPLLPMVMGWFTLLR